MNNEKLTCISEITGLPMLAALKESCGESSCADVCEDYREKGCAGCPVQAAISKLYEIEHPQPLMTKIEGMFTLIEDVLDLVTESRNCRSDEMLVEAYDKLLKVRDFLEFDLIMHERNPQSLTLELLQERDTVKIPIPNKRIPVFGKCQVCKTELCLDDDELYFCPKCGQRLKAAEVKP